MRASVPKATRAILWGLVASLAACSDGSAPLVPVPDQPHLVLENSTETLANGVSFSSGAAVSWDVSVPSSGWIYLIFDGRIDYPSTAGNSTILEILVNGVSVKAGNLFKKDTLYTYPNRGGTENYYDLRGGAWGQADKYWGLFWSPDFVSNNTSTDYYYVQGANAYNFVMNISRLVKYGQVNTITVVNRGGWVVNATGLSPTIALRDVKVRSVNPLVVELSASDYAPPNGSCAFFASASGGTSPYSYQWYVDGWAVGTNSSELIYTNNGSDFTVAVYVTDAAGTTVSDSQFVDVEPNTICQQ